MQRLRGWKPWVGAVVAILVVAVVSFLVWALHISPADQTKLTLVKNNSKISYSDQGGYLSMIPTTNTGQKGMIFYPGAKVPADAYAYKLSGLVEAGVTVIIIKPTLNLAFFDHTDTPRIEAKYGFIKTWYVAGHSLGGVKACQEAANSDLHYAGLILLGSYCANTIADGMPVLSVAGGQDGLSTPAKIEANKKYLPSNAVFVTINGLNHAGFGDYGPQSGDNQSSLSSEEARQDITDAIMSAISGGSVAYSANKGVI